MASKTKPICKYGTNCYRKNRSHQQAYEHVKNEDDLNGSMNKRMRCDNDVEEKDKENIREDLSKTIEMRSDDELDLDKIDKIDLTKIEDMKSLVDEHNHGMKMPDDFYEFLDFCKSIDSKDPKNALKVAGLELTGIYDLVCRGLKLDYRTHARYFYDVPEFQTVLSVKDNQNFMHFGYFRDDPNEMPSFVGINEAKLDCKIHCKGDNIFAAVNWYLEELISGRTYKSKSSGGSSDEIKTLKERLNKWCDQHHKGDKTFSLQLKTPKIKAREKKINCKTFHTAGLCVPVDSRGFGYRDVPETEDKQKKLFENFCNNEEESKSSKALERIQEIITFIQFANDETDYGMGVEFGLNMFCFGDLKLHKFMKSTILVSYKLLGRDLYADILAEHLKNRKIKL